MNSLKHVWLRYSLVIIVSVFLLATAITGLPASPAVAGGEVLRYEGEAKPLALSSNLPPTLPLNALITPTNGVTLTTPWPAFAWQAAVDDPGETISYTLVVTGGGSYNFWGQTTTASVVLTTTSYRAGQPLPNDVYTWTVVARASDGETSDPASPATFVISAGIVFPAGAFVAPADGIILSNPQPQFDWLEASHPAQQALTYTLLITSSGVATSVLGQTTTATVVLSTTSFTPAQPLADDVYTWTVRAQDAAGRQSGPLPPFKFILDQTPKFIFLPLVLKNASFSLCPTLSVNTFQRIPVDGPLADRPAPLHGDLNLALRGYAPTTAFLGLINVGNGADPDAPQLAGLFNPTRSPTFLSVYRVNNWDWSCGLQGCPGPPITNPEVTMAGLAATPGESIFIPERNPSIYQGNYKAMVLYADEQRITLGYTRRDTVAVGYAVHIEGVCIDPNLLALYRAQTDSQGWHVTGFLPALRNDQALGTALGQEVQVVIRDQGTFLDPRSRKDWWQGF